MAKIRTILYLHTGKYLIYGNATRAGSRVLFSVGNTIRLSRGEPYIVDQFITEVIPILRNSKPDEYASFFEDNHIQLPILDEDFEIVEIEYDLSEGD